MNFFGTSPLEILLIVVLALIVFGPEKLPEIMGRVGRAVAEFRRVSTGLSDEFNRSLQSELAETKVQPPAEPEAIPRAPQLVSTPVPAGNGTMAPSAPKVVEAVGTWTAPPDTAHPDAPAPRTTHTGADDDLLPPY